MYRGLIFALTVTVISVAVPSTAQGGDRLAGSEWGPGYPAKQFIRFDADGKVSGTGGCNRIFGSFVTTGADKISIGPLASTKMACPQEVMAREKAFIDMLENATAYRRGSAQLTFHGENGEELATLCHLDQD